MSKGNDSTTQPEDVTANINTDIDDFAADDDVDSYAVAASEEDIPEDNDVLNAVNNTVNAATSPDDNEAADPSDQSDNAQSHTSDLGFYDNKGHEAHGIVFSNIKSEEAYGIIPIPESKKREVYERNKRLGIQPATTPGALSRRIIVDYFQHEYFSDHDTRTPKPGMPDNLEELAIDVLERINQANAMRTAMVKGVYGKGAKDYIYPHLRRLSCSDITFILLNRYSFANIAPSAKNSDPDLDMLCMYDGNPDSEQYGLYVNSDRFIASYIRGLCYELSVIEVKNIFEQLKVEAPRGYRGGNRDLIAVKNGIFNYKTKQLHDFHPGHIFMSKLQVNFNPDAQKPLLSNPDDDYIFDIEEWMLDLADNDTELCETLWQIIGAITRPYVSWNKAAFFYSTVGNNGKGTLVELMRNICGTGTYATIPLADLGKDFMLEPLTRASAILVDENDVGAFIDRAANLKTIITNDVLSINRKYRAPIAYQFYGFMVQCLNDMPQFKDRSESFYRRQLFIPFKKSFTGAERRYIKDDFMQRQDVLEYVLKRVLLDMDDYYELNAPEAALDVLKEFKVNNDPVRGFWEDLREEFVWDLLPFTFLYDLYKEWLRKAIPNAVPLGRNKFIKQLTEVVNSYPDSAWEVPSNDGGRARTGAKMNLPEPLIGEYNLTDWENHTVAKTSKNRFKPQVKDTYNGFVRIAHTQPANVPASTVTADSAASNNTADTATADASSAAQHLPTQTTIDTLQPDTENAEHTEHTERANATGYAASAVTLPAAQPRDVQPHDADAPQVESSRPTNADTANTDESVASNTQSHTAAAPSTPESPASESASTPDTDTAHTPAGDNMATESHDTRQDGHARHDDRPGNTTQSNNPSQEE